MQRLIHLQKISGKTQLEFANLIGMSQSKYSKMISGKQKPTADLVTALMNNFGVHPQWLSGELESDVPVYLSDFIEKKKYESLLEEKIKLVEEVAALYRKLNEKAEEDNKRLKNIESTSNKT